MKKNAEMDYMLAGGKKKKKKIIFELIKLASARLEKKKKFILFPFP